MENLLKLLNQLRDTKCVVAFPDGTCCLLSIKNSTAHWFYRTSKDFRDLYREEHSGSKYLELKQEIYSRKLKLVYHDDIDATSIYKVDMEDPKYREYLKLRIGATIKSTKCTFDVHQGRGDTNFVRIEREDFRIDGPSWFTEYTLFRSSLVSEHGLIDLTVFHNLDWEGLKFFWRSLNVSNFEDETFDQLMFQRRIGLKQRTIQIKKDDNGERLILNNEKAVTDVAANQNNHKGHVPYRWIIESLTAGLALMVAVIGFFVCSKSFIDT